MGTNNVTRDSGDDDGITFGIEAILGITIGGTLMLLGLTLCIICACCWNKKKSGTKKTTNEKELDIEKNAVTYKNVGSKSNDYTKSNTKSNKTSKESLATNVPTAGTPKGSYVNQAITSSGKTAPFSIMTAMEDAMRKTIESYIIASNRLNLETVIGKGSFGLVYKAKLKDKNMKSSKDVAVKTVHEKDVSHENISTFLQEVLRMKGFMHKNVLTMIGLVFKEDIPYVVLPYMENNDLRSYLKNSDLKFNIGDLIDMGMQIAEGMSYLSEQGYVHRDLAARNCMVDKERIIKVADFGLSRDIFFEDYYVMEEVNTPLPIRWMAKECIKSHIFSTKSDVWSFGVVLWEIMTRGEQPYSKSSNAEVMKFITEGKKLTMPEYCPSAVYTIMLKCWAIQASKRPSFQEISELLQEVLSGATMGKKDKQYYNLVKQKEKKNKKIKK